MVKENFNNNVPPFGGIFFWKKIWMGTLNLKPYTLNLSPYTLNLLAFVHAAF